jgi:hypothetical protein
MPARIASLSLVLILGACGRADDNLPPASEFPAHGHPARTILKAAGERPVVLRYQPTAGQSDPLAITSDITVTVDAQGAAVDMGLGMDLEATTAIDSVKPEGEFRQTMEIGEARVSLRGVLAESGAHGGDVARAIKGLKMAFDMDPHGQLQRIDLLEGSSSMVGQLGQMQAGLDQALQGGVVPFPSEPIGVGGRWESLATIDSMGAKIRGLTAFELKSLEGSRGRLDMSMTGRADAQTIKMPNVPSEVDVEFISMTSKGTIDFDLTRPTAARVELTLEMKMALSVRGERALMTMTAVVNSRPRG